LANRKGESVIDEINSVEDTKGNNGERGSLVRLFRAGGRAF
jgi:Bardet-Biedl syndrome 5 protein